MDYLICDFCGSSNEVKSEYLTFCNNCEKKLPNNFSEWQKDHPDKSFEQYKTAVCQHSIIRWEAEPVLPIKRKPTPWKYALLFTLLAIVGMGIFWTINEEYYPTEEIQEWATKNINFNKPEIELWNSFTFHEGNFEMKFPSKPDKITEQTETAAGILNINSYTSIPSSAEDDNLSYTVSYITYPVDMINSRLLNKAQTLEFFNYTINGVLKMEEGVMKTKNEIVYGLYPGREITAGTDKGLTELKCRLYLVENTLYIIKVSTAYQNSGNSSGDVFLNSFKLLAYAQSLGLN